MKRFYIRFRDRREIPTRRRPSLKSALRVDPVPIGAFAVACFIAIYALSPTTRNIVLFASIYLVFLVSYVILLLRSILSLLRRLLSYAEQERAALLHEVAPSVYAARETKPQKGEENAPL